MPIAFQPDAFQNDAFQVDDYPAPLVSDLLPPSASISMTIAGSTWYYHLGTLDIVEQINGRNTLSLEVFSFDGSARPAVDDEIILVRNGVRIYGGIVEDVDETSIGGETAGAGLSFLIRATDFNSYTDRRFINNIFPSQTVKISLQFVVLFLAPYGVTLDPAQIDGPILPSIPFVLKDITEILNTMCSIASTLTVPPQAVAWEIDYNKVLRIFGALDVTSAAPFNVPGSPTIMLGGANVKPQRTDYANSVLVFFGTGQRAVIDTVAVGDGIVTSFALNYSMYANETYVNVGGSLVSGVITGGTNETLGLSGSGATWIWDPTTNTISRTPAPVGLILVPYTAAYPALVGADSGAAAADLVEKAYTEPEVFDIVVAQAIATSLLQRHLIRFKEVVYETASDGAHPGQVQTITLTKYSVSGIHLITRVRISDVTETELRHEITALSGTDAVPESWMATYDQWGKSGGGGGAASSVAVVTTTLTRQPYFLGGSAALYVQDPTPTWTPADAVRVTIDSSVRGTLTGTVSVRLRAAAGDVTARLWNLTDSVVAGTSAVVSTTTWTDITFTATLGAGSKVYELQVLPSLPNTDVAAVGYFE